MNTWKKMMLVMCVLSSGGALRAQVDAEMELGQKFVGAIHYGADEDLVTFQALEGQKIHIKIKGRQGLKPYAQLEDAVSGSLINTSYSERGRGTRKFQIRNFTAPATTTYLLRIMSSDGSEGPYTCSTSGVLIRSLHQRFYYSEWFSPGEVKLLPFEIFSGAKLSATLKPTSGSAFPSLSSVSGPQSNTGTSAYTTTTSSKVKLKNLPLYEFGRHYLAVENVGQAGSIKIKFKLRQPYVPGRTYYEDSDDDSDDDSNGNTDQEGGISGTLSVEDLEVVPEQEPNDTMETAQFSGVLLPGEIIRNLGTVSSSNDGDVYQYRVEGPQQISVMMLFDKALDLDIDFYNGQTGDYIGSLNSSSEPETGTITYNLAPGQFALMDVVVYSYSGTGGYLLRLVSSPSTGAQNDGSGLPSMSAASPSSRVRPDWVTDRFLGADQEFVPGEFIVVLEEERARPESWAREHGLSVRIASPSGAFVAKLPSREGLLEADLKRDTMRVLHRARNLPGVKYIEPNAILHASAVPNDPKYGVQWHYPMINLPQAWEITQGSADVIVAVIDTGIVAHPDLDGRDSGMGYDMISDPSRARDGNGQDPDPSDEGDQAYPDGSSSWHGTHVAGTVGAESNNGQGVAGVDWNCRLMHIRVLGANGGSLYDIGEGIKYAARLQNSSGALPAQRADVINMSLGGGGYYQFMQDAVSAARAQGVVIVAAAGNDNTSVLAYPASYDGVISVSAVDDQMNRAYYSNYGSRVDVAAPGGDQRYDRDQDGISDAVYSTIVDEQQGVYSYTAYEGTSMASPHVAGVCALLLAVDPSLTPSEVENLLVTSAQDLGAAGRDDVFGHGLVDAYAAVQAANTNPGGPVLSVSPLFLDFGTNSTSRALSIVNTGNGTLDFAASNHEDQGGHWMQSSPDSGNVPGSVTVSVNRAGLSQGVYTGTVTIQAVPASYGSVIVNVRMEVAGSGDQPVLDMGPIYVLALDPGSFSLLAGDVANQSSPAYSFGGLSVGQRLVVAGPDLDNDGFICGPGEPCGVYASFDAPLLVPVASGEFTTGTDFGVRELTELSSFGRPYSWPAQGFPRTP